jgi:hypothetical protein
MNTLNLTNDNSRRARIYVTALELQQPYTDSHKRAVRMLTRHAELIEAGQPTGYSHPDFILEKCGVEVTASEYANAENI